MRQKYVKLVDFIKDSGSTVHVFSSMHVSGEHKYYFPSFLASVMNITSSTPIEIWHHYTLWGGSEVHFSAIPFWVNHNAILGRNVRLVCDHIYSVSTELPQLTWTAAILQLPLPELEDIEMWWRFFEVSCPSLRIRPLISSIDSLTLSFYHMLQMATL